MQTIFESSGSIEEFASVLNKLNSDKSVKGIVILSSDANNYTPRVINKILKSSSKPLIGGIFPAIIYEDQQYEKGTVFAGLESEPMIRTIKNLSSPEADYEELIDEQISDTDNFKTMFVFVDGFARRIGSFIEGLFNIFGLEMNYIGGGAGSLSMKQKPCLFTNEGFIQDSAVVALSGISSGIGVSHGWEKVSGPLKVTESDRNKVISLDWEPAFKIYKKIVESHSGELFRKDNFFEIAKGYPLGIKTLSDEEIIRDLIAVDANGALICVGEVPQDSFVDIMNGKKNTLVRAAGNALIKAKNEYSGQNKIKTVVFMDCISRVLFLEGEFWRELSMIQEPGTKIFGALTIGEIANNKKDYLEFFNKTSVIGVMDE